MRMGAFFGLRSTSMDSSDSASPCPLVSSNQPLGALAMTSPVASLSAAELLYGDFALEYANTRRMLERYPDGKGEWRPHPRSRSLAELGTHVADIVYRGIAVLETNRMESGARR